MVSPFFVCTAKKQRYSLAKTTIFVYYIVRWKYRCGVSV